MRTYLIDDFERDNDGWHVEPGHDHTGGPGRFVRDSVEARTGEHSGLLSADFGAAGEPESVYVGRAVDLDLVTVTGWVRTDDARRIRIRLTDRTGQTHQLEVDVRSGPEWQPIELAGLDTGDSHEYWGGANDGVWHGPARWIAFGVDRSDLLSDRTVAYVRFDDLSAICRTADIDIEQVRPGNVFTDGEDVRFTIRSTADTLSWRVYDYSGEPVASGRENVSGTHRLRVPVKRYGHYRLELSVERADQTIVERTTEFAVVADNPVNDEASSFFGISAHFAEQCDPAMIPLARKAGITCVRDELYWHNVEVQPSTYRFPSRYNTYMAGLAEHGIDPLLIVSYVNPHYDSAATPHTDHGRDGFAAYAVASVQRYQPWIRRVEVYNEFNIPEFGAIGGGPAGCRADYYFALLKRTYEALHELDPDITVIGGATAGPAVEWFDELFRLGGLDFMDVVSVHAYPHDPAMTVDRFDELEALIRTYNNGKPKPIWLTECGWSTSIGGPPWAPGVPESTQAAALVRSHVAALARGVERYFWYDLMDDGIDEQEKGHNFGLLRHPANRLGRWTPKPAYVAYATMTRMLTGTTFRAYDDLGAQISSAVFTANHQPGMEIRVIWSNARHPVAISTEEPVVVTDLVGHSTTYSPRSGRVVLALSEDPLYVAGSDLALASTDEHPPDHAGTRAPTNRAATVSLTNVLQDKADALGVTITNPTGVDLEVGQLAWNISDHTGTVEVPSPIPSHGNHTVWLPLDGVPSPSTNPIDLRLTVPGHRFVRFTGTLELRPGVLHRVMPSIR